MHRPTALLLALLTIANCASDRPAVEGPEDGQARADATAGGTNPAIPLLIGVAVGAGLLLVLLANSSFMPDPDPPG